MAKVSVIIPIYNVEKYISDCLESLTKQTLHDIEIVCVDDCSPDKSIKIAQQYATQDARIKIIRHAKNSGVAAARNTGLDRATAPYIMWCDPDDWYAPDMCEKMYNAIELSGADFAVCGMQVFYEANKDSRASDENYYRVKFNGCVDISRDVKNQLDSSLCNKIWRRSIVTKYNIRFPDGLRYEDACFLWKYTLWAKKAYFISDKLYNYRRRSGSIMNKTFAGTTLMGLDHIYIVFAYYEYLKKWFPNDTQKEHEFWLDKFIPYVNIAFDLVQDIGNMTSIVNQLSHFVSLNYITQNYSFMVERTLQQIKNKTFRRRNRKIIGLYYVKESPDKRTVRICGVPMFITEYYVDRTKWCLFGVPVYNKPTVKGDK